MCTGFAAGGPSTGTSLPVSLYVYDMKVESAVRINTRARLYVKVTYVLRVPAPALPV